MQRGQGTSNFISTHEASRDCLSGVRHTQYVVSHPFVKLPNVVILFCFFMMYKSKASLCFCTCLLKQIFVISFNVSQIFFLFFVLFSSLRSCIVISSSLAVGVSRVSHKHCGQAHFSQDGFPAFLRDVS